MSLFVYTGVWSLALRRDGPSSSPQVVAPVKAIEHGEPILTSGLVLQELLQGFSGPKDREQILDRFSALPLLVSDRADHIEAAALRNTCRRHGVQIGTIDALSAQLSIRHSLLMVSPRRAEKTQTGGSRLAAVLASRREEFTVVLHEYCRIFTADHRRRSRLTPYFGRFNANAPNQRARPAGCPSFG